MTNVNKTFMQKDKHDKQKTNIHRGVKVSVLLGIITYLKKLPEIHKAKTSCGKRYQDQTKPVQPDKTLPWEVCTQR